MKIESIRHENVLPNGTFINKAGAVETRGCIRMSDGRGCGLKGCHCSDGHWLMIAKPRTEDGIVEGIKVKFDDCGEMRQFLQARELINIF